MGINEIKPLLKSDKLIIGNERVVKLLKKGSIAKVFTASNASQQTKESLAYYAKIADVTLEDLDVPNDEIGLLCRKPFSISVIGIAK